MAAEPASEPLDSGLTGLAQDYDVVVVSGRPCGSLSACVNDPSSTEIFGGLHQTKPGAAFVSVPSGPNIW